VEDPPSFISNNNSIQLSPEFLLSSGCLLNNLFLGGWRRLWLFINWFILNTANSITKGEYLFLFKILVHLLGRCLVNELLYITAPLIGGLKLLFRWFLMSWCMTNFMHRTKWWSTNRSLNRWRNVALCDSLLLLFVLGFLLRLSQLTVALVLDGNLFLSTGLSVPGQIQITVTKAFYNPIFFSTFGLLYVFMNDGRLRYFRFDKFFVWVLTNVVVAEREFLFWPTPIHWGYTVRFLPVRVNCSNLSWPFEISLFRCYIFIRCMTLSFEFRLGAGFS
jgi:hypothetical protein